MCFFYQNSKGGSFSSQNVPNGMHVSGNVSSSTKAHGISDAEAGLTPEAYRRRHEITVTVSPNNNYTACFVYYMI